MRLVHHSPLQVLLQACGHFVRGADGFVVQRLTVGMVSPFEDPSPLCEQSLIARGEGKGSHFVGGEPPEFDAFRTGLERGILRRDEHPADVEMFVLWLVSPRGYGVDVEIERAWRREDEPFDPAFFEGFALGHTQHIFVSIAVTTEGEPFVQFTMVVEKSLRSVGTDEHHASGEVCGEC